MARFSVRSHARRNIPYEQPIRRDWGHAYPSADKVSYAYASDSIAHEEILPVER